MLIAAPDQAVAAGVGLQRQGLVRPCQPSPRARVFAERTQRGLAPLDARPVSTGENGKAACRTGSARRGSGGNDFSFIDFVKLFAE